MKGIKKSRGCGCISFNKRSISSYEDESTSSCRSSDTEAEEKPRHRRIKSDGGLFRFFFPRNFFKSWRRDENLSMTKVERTMKAALLIQRWYRRYLARMEVRRRYTWTIFQSIEYAAEQDQMKLYNFFNALLTHIPESTTRPMSSTATSKSSSIDTLYTRFEDESDDAAGEEEDTLQNGDRADSSIHINFPMQRSDLDTLINAFRKKKHHRLHARYVAGILKESASQLKRLPNLNQASTAISKQITICGDLHGKMDDLLVVFHKGDLEVHESSEFSGELLRQAPQSTVVRPRHLRHTSRKHSQPKPYPKERPPPLPIGHFLPGAGHLCCSMPGRTMISTSATKKFVVLSRNGLPSAENPYVFNGDFVDRGKKGLEVFLLLLSCMLIFPGGVFLNRGNHEDYIMNSRYGFVKEVQSKYKHNSEKLLKLIEGVYRWLPLGTIVNNKVLIVHGGISDTTDLDLIKSLDRGKVNFYVSLLRPPITDSSAPGAELIDKVEWKQVFDILWSDPQPGDGCIPNGLRGAGTYFGPDVTKKFLKKNKMMYLIRSHECKPDGYELIHNNKVITIFSASNYYELGSNKGAYLKLVGPQLDTHFVQYTAATGKTKRLTFRQRIGLVESSAIRELRSNIICNRTLLEMEFLKSDPESTGYITVNEWCKAMETATGLGLPWRMLRDKLVVVGPDLQMVKYSSTFDRVIDSDITTVHGASTVVETLYRNKSSLEAIFRIIDKDNSGFISLEEFSDACHLIREHMSNPISHNQLLDMCKLMDMNKDGLVDLNEFLETFRMVDPEQNVDSKGIQRKNSKPSTANGLPENDKQQSEVENATKDVESSLFGSPIHNSTSPNIDSLPSLSSPKKASDVNVTITNTFPLSLLASPHIEANENN